MNNENNFEIGLKSEQLYFAIFDGTTNRNHYPVKFRRLADSLQKYALEIHNDILDANAYRLHTDSHNEKRFELQTRAITSCNKLLSLIKYSYHANLISVATSERWTALAHDVKYMTLAWRKA